MADEEAGEAILPAEQRLVQFYEDSIPVARIDGAALYVPLRPIADALGLQFGPQRRRVLRDEVLTQGLRTILAAGADGRQRAMLAIPLEQLPGWLFGIDSSRVKPELREKIVRYRLEAFRVLWQAFSGDVAAAIPSAPALPTGSTTLTLAEQALQMATAVQQMAQAQVELERRVGKVEQQQGVMADYVRGFILNTRERLGALEQAVDPEAHIDRGQQRQISGAVKEVAYALGGEREHYMQVYGTLYRKFDISAYGELPRARFDEAGTWLRDWYEELVAKQKGAK